MVIMINISNQIKYISNLKVNKTVKHSFLNPLLPILTIETTDYFEHQTILLFVFVFRRQPLKYKKVLKNKYAGVKFTTVIYFMNKKN